MGSLSAFLVVGVLSINDSSTHQTLIENLNTSLDIGQVYGYAYIRSSVGVRPYQGHARGTITRKSTIYMLVRGGHFHIINMP